MQHPLQSRQVVLTPLPAWDGAMVGDGSNVTEGATDDAELEGIDGRETMVRDCVALGDRVKGAYTYYTQQGLAPVCGVGAMLLCVISSQLHPYEGMECRRNGCPP